MNKTTLSLAVAGLLMSAGAMAEPQTVSGSFDVSATVVAACNIDTTGPLEFGAYNPVSGDSVDGSTVVGVRCTNDHPYQIGLDLGVNSDVAKRRMSAHDDTAFLDYELFSDSGRDAVWGQVDVAAVNDTGSGLRQDHTIYGRINADQEQARLGSYTDTVTITVSY